MAETHPNALLMEATEKRETAAKLLSEATELEARANALLGNTEPVAQEEQAAQEPAQPDGFPVREEQPAEVQPTPEQIDQTLESVEQPAAPQADGFTVPVNVPVQPAVTPVNVEQPQPVANPLDQAVIGQ